MQRCLEGDSDIAAFLDENDGVKIGKSTCFLRWGKI